LYNNNTCTTILSVDLLPPRRGISNQMSTITSRIHISWHEHVHHSCGWTKTRGDSHSQLTYICICTEASWHLKDYNGWSQHFL